MPRLLSASMITAKNMLESVDAWAYLIRLDMPAAPASEYMTAHDQDITFQGQVYTATRIVIPLMEDNDASNLVTLTAFVENVSQNIVSLLENYWAAIAPTPTDWTANIWLVDTTQPDEVLLADASVFRILQVNTDLQRAEFRLRARGISPLPGYPPRRFTSTGGFSTLV